MRRIPTLAIAVLLCVLPQRSSQGEQSLSQARPGTYVEDAAVVRSLHEKLWRSFGDRDLWAIGELWDKEDRAISVIFPAAGTPAIGWENVAESFRRTFAHNRDIKIKTKILRTYRTGDLTWLTATVRFSANQTQTGQPVMINRLLASEIYARRHGQWKLVHYHAHSPDFVVPPVGAERATVNSIVPKRNSSRIWTTYDKFNAAFQGRDLAKMFQMFDQDDEVVAIQPKSPIPFIGLENVLASWKKTFDDIQAITIDPQVLELSETDEVSWITDLSQCHIVFKDNPNEVVHFHNVMTTFIFRKQSGEEWRLAYYHAHLGYSLDEHND
jgi:ketosteroid isomerase-like protein